MKGDGQRGVEAPVAASMVEEHGRALLQAIPDLVFHLGLDGRYLDVFSAPDEDLFMPLEALLGRTVLDVLPSPVGEDCMAAIGRLATASDVATFDYELTIDDQQRWFEGRVARCGPESVICVVRDFTDQRLAEHGLQEANDALRERATQLQRLSRELTLVEERERRRLAALLHDELQQLLVGAKCQLATAVHGLGEGAATESIRRASAVITEAIRQSQSLTVELCPPVLQEGGLVHALEWLAESMGETHGLDVDFVDGGGRCEPVPESLRVVLYHAVRELLLNVVKHAGTMAATLEVACDAGHGVRLIVSDHGCGFDASTLAHQPAVGGFGLFAIQERLEPFGGTLTCGRAEGGGGCATLVVPVQEETEGLDQTPATPVPSAPPPEPSVAWATMPQDDAIRVVVVDDHVVVRQGICQLLKQHPEMSVVGEAEDGVAAFARVAETLPDVVLMDLNMPGCNGIEATRRIHAAYPDVEIIGLSMYNESHRVREMIAAGASAYISKSEAAVAVVSTIHEVLDR